MRPFLHLWKCCDEISGVSVLCLNRNVHSIDKAARPLSVGITEVVRPDGVWMSSRKRLERLGGTGDTTSSEKPDGSDDRLFLIVLEQALRGANLAGTRVE